MRMPQINTKTALLVTMLFISILYAFYSGFRAPNLWSVNYYQASFMDGFYRRALAGTVLVPFGCERFDYFFIQKIQFLVLILALGLLVFLGIKSREFITLGIFFASSAGGYFFHEVGYIEQLLWLMAALIILAIRNNRIYFAAAGLCLSIMVHEMALFMVLPIALAFMVVHKIGSLSLAIRVFMPSLVTFLILYKWFQVVPVSTIMQYFEHASSCGYPVIRTDYFSIYQSQFLGQRAQMYYSVQQLILGIFPVVILAAGLVISVRKKLSFSWMQSGFILLCCVSPILLGFFGWDTDRWIFLAFAQTIIVWMIAASRMRVTDSGKLMGSPLFLIALILVALLLRLEYFDNFAPRILSLDNLMSFMDYVVQQTTMFPQR